MELKALPLQNLGMNRDTSISKVEGSAAYENRNIRITIDKDNTLLSVTNERGNVPVEVEFDGVLIGWNVLNTHLILFTTTTELSTDTPLDRADHIYRADYNGTTFVPVELFSGNLGFDQEHPIESVVDFESEDIQKIYWVDGKNVLRFMNFMDEREYNQYSFDSNARMDYGLRVSITKTYSGNNRPNGVAQYLVTYYNKFGQQTGMVWASDMVYLSPSGTGGSPEGTNTCAVVLTLTDMDTSFTNFRVYSIFRTSLDMAPVGYLVYDGVVSEDKVIVVDDGAHLETVDADSLLFLGSYAVKAGTLAHKDGTLFLGDLKSIDRADYSDLEKAIRDNMFEHSDGRVTWEEGDWKSSCIEFMYSDDSIDGIHNIPYVDNEGSYQYDSQLELTSSEICSFKGGEKYRFALVFKTANGVSSDAFWIGDATNNSYPIVDCTKNELRRIVAKCTIPSAVLAKLSQTDFKTVQLHIAKATYADRSVKAQGIINPTMFNVWKRFNDGLYSQSSWISRPRNSGYAWKHFEPVHNSTSSTGEIQCNYWSNNEYDPAPYYQLQNYDDAGNTKFYVNSFEGSGDLDGEANGDYLMLVYCIWYEKPWGFKQFYCRIWTIRATLGSSGDEDSITALQQYIFENITSSRTIRVPDTGDEKYTIEVTVSSDLKGGGTGGNSRTNLYTEVRDYLMKSQDINVRNIVGKEEFKTVWCSAATEYRGLTVFNQNTGSTGIRIAAGHADTEIYKALNWDGSETKDASSEDKSTLSKRWIPLSIAARGDMSAYDAFGSYESAYYKQHLMFVDENVVTLDSPELAYGALGFDRSDYKFRIVGVARMTSGLSDYKVDATQGKLSGTNLLQLSFNSTPSSANHDGIISWPLWSEYGLTTRRKENDGTTDHVLPTSVDRYTSDDYMYHASFANYWLYMWNKSGDIDAYSRGDDTGFSVLQSKTFANLKYSYDTIYKSGDTPLWEPVKDDVSGKVDNIRLFNYVASQYLRLKVGEQTKYYDAYIDDLLTLPGSHKYPVLYSVGASSTDLELTSNSYFLRSAVPVPITYGTNPHAVISLPTEGELGISLKPSTDTPNKAYTQTILPRLFNKEAVDIPVAGTATVTDGETTSVVNYTDAMCPWLDGLQLPFNYVYAVPRYADDPDITPPATVTTPYDPKSKTVSMQIMRTSELPYWLAAWSKGQENFKSEDIYATVTAEEDGVMYNYIVCVSGLEAIEGSATLSELKDADVKARVAVGETGNILRVNSFGYKEEDIVINATMLMKVHMVLIGMAVTDGDPSPDPQTPIDYIDDGGPYNPSPIYPDNPGGGSGSSSGTETVEEGGKRQILIPGQHVLIPGTSELKSMAFVNFPAYRVKQDEIRSLFTIDTENGAHRLTSDDRYLYIGEIYQDYQGNDTRYGGTSSNDAERCDYIAAGPQYNLSDFNSESAGIIYGNQGDTYFQRWDCLRSKPLSASNPNSVIDITSFMVETHINLDGIYDTQRGAGKLASIDASSYGEINPVYAQSNDFFVQVDQDEKYNLDTYRSSVTWTLEKSDAADIDEWTHITLASTLKLDGDKGICRALRRFQNSLIAFQDRGISEILFNSRTQLSTTNGVPVEIANSGKVDGKRYISNKHGCINKWSIVEGKAGLYFVDNINKIFARVGNEGIENLSTALRFDSWFRRNNRMSEWTPKHNDNFISFYDRVNSDVYLVSNNEDEEQPTLVYNEQLNLFTSFYDYNNMWMLTNVEDRLVSWHDGLWFQNEGSYLNLFGVPYPCSVTYRAIPNPYTDKIWTGLEYRADFYDVSENYNEDELIDAEKGLYLPDETFNKLRVWNEYQSTEDINPYRDDRTTLYPDIRKRFRKWKMDIPRAKADAANNRFGLDRIRNPWVFIKLTRDASEDNNNYLMQMHDMVVKYFE